MFMLKYDMPFIYKKVTELLHEYDKPYKIRSRDPSVDIWNIAQEGFDAEIKFIPENEWPYANKHAFADTEDGVFCINLNEKDKSNETRCRFSIAHELGHFAFSHIALPSKVACKLVGNNIANERMQLFNTIAVENVIKIKISEQQLKYMRESLFKLSEKDLQVPPVFLNYLFKPDTAKHGSKRQKKYYYNVSHEWGHIVFNDSYSYKVSPRVARPITSNPVSRAFRLVFKNNKGRDELADHFAANLLVPIYRFQHYLDKSDNELAGYFKVEEKCIKKRRKEIKAEMNVLTAAVKPLANNEISVPGDDYVIKEVASS
jgi:Zn-dependent peptidase ImmA (M78 family)